MKSIFRVLQKYSVVQFQNFNIIFLKIFFPNQERLQMCPGKIKSFYQFMLHNTVQSCYNSSHCTFKVGSSDCEISQVQSITFSVCFKLTQRRNLKSTFIYRSFKFQPFTKWFFIDSLCLVSVLMTLKRERYTFSFFAATFLDAVFANRI